MIFRRSRVEASSWAELAAAHTDHFGRAPNRPLAAARGQSGWCVLLPEWLAYEQRGEWRFVAWHEIENGSWNDQNHEVRWEELGGRRGNVLLEDPGRVPEVFKERVQASIVLHRDIAIEGTREGGVISARRDLSDRDAPLQWRIRRGRGTEDTPENRAVLEACLTELRSDFDI